MSDLAATSPRGALRSGWTATVEDYAIAGGWTCGGKVLVVVDAGGGVSGFEGRSGERRWHHPAVHTDGALAMTVHPNGAEFATTGQDGRIVIWDAAVGEIKTSVNVGKGWVEHAAWSPDGNRLAVSLSRRVYVYDAKGQELWHSEDHPSTVSATAWAGSDELATACYGRVSFLEASSGTLRQKLEWKGSLVSMVLSPDGEVVACGSQDNTVHFWRRSTGEDSMMAGYFAKPSALAFDHTGTLLATSGGEIVTVWSFADGGPGARVPARSRFTSRPSLPFVSHPWEASCLRRSRWRRGVVGIGKRRTGRAHWRRPGRRRARSARLATRWSGPRRPRCPWRSHYLARGRLTGTPSPGASLASRAPPHQRTDRVALNQAQITQAAT